MILFLESDFYTFERVINLHNLNAGKFGRLDSYLEEI